MRHHIFRYALGLGCLLWASDLPALERVVVRLDPNLAQQPQSGRLFVFFSQKEKPDPRFGPDWGKPEPFFGRDIQQLKPGDIATIGDGADGFPAALSKLPPGKYRVQAVLHQDPDSPHPGNGVGDPFSEVAAIELAATTQEISLELKQRIPEPAFVETAWRKEIKLRSESLSKFHGREVLHRAAVVLPEKYDDEPDRRYPVLFVIHGFGDSHRGAMRMNGPVATADTGEPFIRVLLNGSCEWGHHVFADSAKNGPRGQSLIDELIPHIDRSFRTIAAPTARFVTGHSSGGWSSLWLQVTYPKMFGGVWSTAPDPVDFRDYQRVNLYADPPLNMYRDPAGERRPIVRSGDKPIVWYDDFTKMDDVIARGGQLRSFEAVFSPLDERGSPLPMYDRRTGQVDPRVAAAWKAYDIRLKIERDWKTLAPQLSGNLHIYMGDRDTYYLEGAVVRLAESLKQLGSDAEIEIVPGANHSSLMTPQLIQRIRQSMVEQFRRHHRP